MIGKFFGMHAEIIVGAATVVDFFHGPGDVEDFRRDAAMQAEIVADFFDDIFGAEPAAQFGIVVIKC